MLMTAPGREARDATWRERAATLAMFLALGLGVGIWAAALPGLKTALSLSDRDLSLALLALSVGSVLSTIATGILAPRFGTGRTTGVAAFALLVAFALPGFARDLPELIACGLAIGLACGSLDIAVNGHASEIERRWRSPIMSSFHAAFSVGGLVGATLGGILAGASWSVAYQLWLPLLAAVLVVVVATPMLGPGAREAKRQGTGFVLPERAALALAGLAMACFLIEGAMADWSGVYMATIVKAAAGAAAAGYAAFSLAMAAGRLVGDPIVERLGARRVVLAGGLTASLGMALAVAVPTPMLATVGFALVGAGVANVVPVLFSAAGRYGSSPSAGVAMVASFGYAAFLGGPPLIGAVATAANLRVGLGLLLVAALLVAAGSSVVERRRAA